MNTTTAAPTTTTTDLVAAFREHAATIGMTVPADYQPTECELAYTAERIAREAKPATQYAELVEGVAHVIASGPIDHYGNWFDPKSVGPMYVMACGLGEDERPIFLPNHGDLVTERPSAEDFELCPVCFAD